MRPSSSISVHIDLVAAGRVDDHDVAPPAAAYAMPVRAAATGSLRSSL